MGREGTGGVRIREGVRMRSIRNHSPVQGPPGSLCFNSHPFSSRGVRVGETSRKREVRPPGVFTGSTTFVSVPKDSLVYCTTLNV